MNCFSNKCSLLLSDFLASSRIRHGGSPLSASHKPPEVLFTIRSRVLYKQLTNRACSSRTGESWPLVVAEQTSLRSVRTATTSGQYSPVRLEQPRLVSCLYGTRLLIVKSTSGGLWLAPKGLPPWRIVDDARNSDKSKLPRVRKTIHWCEIALH